MTGKFVSGMQAHVEHWDGPVTLLIEPDQNSYSGNLDDVWVRTDEMPFKVVLTRFESESAKKTMAEGGLVMGGPDQLMIVGAHKPYQMVAETEGLIEHCDTAHPMDGFLTDSNHF